MNLVKHNDNWLPTMWSDFFDQDWLGVSPQNRKQSNLPAVNIREDDEEYAVELAAPGMKKEDFKVNLEDNILTISAETKMEDHEEDKEKGYTRREFSYQSFRRSFTLPDSAEDENISAEYADGVLTIHIPKKEDARPKPARSIDIS